MTKRRELDALALRELAQGQLQQKANYAVSAVRAASSAHEEGQFYDSGVLSLRMTRDSRIASALEMRAGGLLGLPFTVAPGSSSEAAAAAAARVERIWEDDVPEGELFAMLKSWIMMGFAVGELVWRYDRDLRMMRARVRAWDPQLVRRDRVTGQWFVLTGAVASDDDSKGEHGWVEICPGDGKWLLMTRGEHGFMDAAVRTLGILWIMHEVAWESWATLNERHGIPFMKVKVPAQADAEDKDDFYEGARIVTEEGCALLPQNVDGEGNSYDIEFAEIGAQAWMTHEHLITAINQEISIAILKQNLSTQINAGSFAAAETHMKVLRDVIEADSQLLSNTFRNQYIKVLLEVNLGRNHGIPLPNPVYDFTMDDADGRIQSIKSLIETLKSAKDAGVSIKNVAEIAGALGVDIEEES